MSGGDLTGTVAIVTGVLGRLGAVWVDALLGAGAAVAGLDRRTDHSLALEHSLSRHGRKRFVLLKADLAHRATLEAALAECTDRFGPPSVLVNNAGIDQPPSAEGENWRFGDIPDEVSAGILDVNAHGTLRACQVFGTDLVRHGRGSIINIGSLYAGMAPDPRLYRHLADDPPFLKPPAYGMSKAGVAALTRYLAALWGPEGVRVNTLSPGGVLGAQDETFKKLFRARTPMGRMAEAGDLTGPLLFLASDASRYVTGVELLVDGGYSCW